MDKAQLTARDTAMSCGGLYFMNLLTPHEILAIVKHTKRFKNIFISLQSHPRAKIWIDRIPLHPTNDSIINVF